MRRKVIQIGGSVRSGTTMTSLVLANQSDAIALGEVMHLFYPVKERYVDEVRKLKMNEKWNRIISDKPEHLYKNIFREFPHIKIILDSSKDPFWFKKALDNDDGFEIMRLVTYKHPIDLKRSFEKRNLTNWKKVYKNYYKRFYTVFPETQSVMLDNLLTNPLYIKNLCAKLGLEFSDTKLEYWHREQPNFFGSQTVKKNKLDNELVIHKEAISDQDLSQIFIFLEGKDINKDNLSTEIFSYNPFMITLYWIKDFFLKKRLFTKIKIRI